MNITNSPKAPTGSPPPRATTKYTEQPSAIADAAVRIPAVPKDQAIGAAAGASMSRVATYSPTNFLVGANLPWIHYGEFGANAWQPQGGLSQPQNQAKMNQVLDKLQSLGVQQVRWFLLCSGGAGIVYAPDGTPKGLDPAFFKDMDVAVKAAAAHGMTVMFSLVNYQMFQKGVTTNGVQTGGHADIIRDSAKRQAYLDKVLKPILERYGKNPTIESWDLINEPEWVTLGCATFNPFQGVLPNQMRDFIRDSATYVHRYSSQKATVGSASTLWLPLVKGLDLDFYQAHWYDHFEKVAPLGKNVDRLKLDRPIILGEFPSAGTRKNLTTIMDTARGAGYGGAMVWSAASEDAATNFDHVAQDLEKWDQAHAEDRYHP